MHYTNPVMLLTIHIDSMCCLLIRQYLIPRLGELFQLPRLLERYIQMSGHMQCKIFEQTLPIIAYQGNANSPSSILLSLFFFALNSSMCSNVHCQIQTCAQPTGHTESSNSELLPLNSSNYYT